MGVSISRTNPVSPSEPIAYSFDAAGQEWVSTVSPYVLRAQQILAARLDQFPTIQSGTARALFSRADNREHVLTADTCVAGITRSLYFHYYPWSDRWIHIGWTGSLADLKLRFASEWNLGPEWALDPPPLTKAVLPLVTVACQGLCQNRQTPIRLSFLSLPREIRSLILLQCIEDPVFVTFESALHGDVDDICPKLSQTWSSILSADDETTRALSLVNRQLHQEIVEELAILKRKLPSRQVRGWSEHQATNVFTNPASSASHHEIFLWLRSEPKWTEPRQFGEPQPLKVF